ncbi:MAG: T9SS type A sorting domain-containing protein, partial [Candidatus Delongbacteria bacterium]|nr:T9SS type A sorting domain-containing protein [Candidatus Delongbacteria bacterium]
MKKFMVLMLVVIATGVFAGDWYGKKELLTDIQPHQTSKDTAWYEYGGPAYQWAIPYERATFYDATTFGLTYPITLHAITSYLNTADVAFDFIIYDADGESVLWRADSLVSAGGWNTLYLDPDSLIVHNDFYISVAPYEANGTPNQVSDAGGDDSNHSFYGYPGNWVPFNGADNRYDWNHSFYASPYNGTDVFEPQIASIGGTENFMDADANITLELIESDAVVAPFNGEYSTDGGSTWNTFVMDTPAKGIFPFTGVIPGQPDGTNALVRFVVEDGLGNTGTTAMRTISWDKDNPILFEGFENLAFPANGWTLNTTGVGFIEGTSLNDGAIHTGSKSAYHADDSGPQDDWLISPLVSLPAANPSTLTFWQYANWLNYVTTGYHEIAVSTDMITWDVIYTGHPDGGPTGIGRVWDYMTLSLMAYMGQDVYVGFRFVGDWEDQWSIDDISILYDYEAPEVTGIMGNPQMDPIVGAYLNNDMVLNLDVFDLSGVASVVGHYTFDEGTTIVELPFAQAKGTEQWTATIPQLAAVDSGLINFDLTDAGGLSTTSADYRIDFIEDMETPIFSYVTGTEAFVNQPMNLTVVFTDESAITSASGTYTKDIFTAPYSFPLTASKLHDYTYVGTIPAEDAELFDGEVTFTIIDAEDNTLTTGVYTVQWKDGQQEFFEDFEGGSGVVWDFGLGTTSGTSWAIVEEGEYTSPTHALTESPGDNYADEDTLMVQLATSLDWTTRLGAQISFMCAYDIEAAFDFMYFDVTTDDGVTWTQLKSWDGHADWHSEAISLDAFVGTPTFNLRWRFISDGASNENGMYIDDIAINTYNLDHIAPLPVYAAPEYLEGVLGDFTDTLNILDGTGVSAAKVIYSVDGTPQTDIDATLVSGDEWQFIIPAQLPGAVIEYTFWAEDNSAFSNSGTSSKMYKIIAGDHQVYDNGYVSYYSTNDEIGAARAVRQTVPGSDAMTTYGAELAYVLIRNYAAPGLISDDMTVHVWQDDGTGQPGVEVIAPFDVAPQSNDLVNTSAMTMIDLRSFGLTVYGDYWVGFSNEHGEVSYTFTRTSEDPAPYFGRSSYASWNGSSWDWTLATVDNYHFRSVLGAASGIEESNIPMTTSLAQNYPNPFNPTTTINFTIASEAKVSLVVYDVMGRAVAKLVDGNLSQGSHKVSFDASSMVSGVYYYNLKSGNVNQTKK